MREQVWASFPGHRVRLSRFPRLSRRVLLVVGLSGALLGASCGSDPATEKLNIEPGEYTLSPACGSCHADIYAGWASSRHASAGLDPLFLQVFEEVAKDDRSMAETLCFQCHSPAHIYGAQNITPQESFKEGIGCDFCHSIVTSDLEGGDRPFHVEFGPVKRGPIKDADSMAHAVQYSDVHLESVMCAGCHEYKTREGVPILTTYSEWQQSSYYEDGVNCQRCHMPYILADVVEPRVKRVAGVAVNLHQMPGGHSRQMMYKAMRARIATVVRDKGKVAVSINVANTGAGHSVPTGTPTRKVVLEVNLISEKGQRQQKEVVFERRLGDAEGQPLDRDCDVFTKSKNVLSDNRLKANEERLESFEFADYPNENLTVEARLIYLYSPHDLKETELRFEFFSEEKHLVSRFGATSEGGGGSH